MAIKISGNTIIDDNQNIISSGIATAANFKTGTTDVHSLGIEVDAINILGGDTPIGSNATIYDNGSATFGSNVDASSFTINGVPVNSSTQVDAKITDLESSLTDGAPTTLNTLNKLAASLGDDANFASSITTSLNTKANSSSLATVATSGSYNDLSNKPSIPTVYNPTITFRTYGHNANADGFTLNQSHNETVTLPQIRYSDLSGQPSIPSVGNATINFYQNNVHKGSFTTNQSGNASIYFTDTDTNTDTNTTYSAGSGLSLSGTQFHISISSLSTLP